MPEETLYYFFSTVAQTLAGVVAILAAFATMYLSDLSRRLEAEVRSLRNRANHQVIVDACLAEGDFAGALGAIAPYMAGGSDDDLMFDVCQKMEAKRREIQAALHWSLLTTGVVILGCVIALAFTVHLSLSPLLGSSSLVGGALALTFCLGLVGLLMVRMASSKVKRGGKSAPGRASS